MDSEAAGSSAPNLEMSEGVSFVYACIFRVCSLFLSRTDEYFVIEFTPNCFEAGLGQVISGVPTTYPCTRLIRMSDVLAMVRAATSVPQVQQEDFIPQILKDDNIPAAAKLMLYLDGSTLFNAKDGIMIQVKKKVVDHVRKSFKEEKFVFIPEIFLAHIEDYLQRNQIIITEGSLLHRAVRHVLKSVSDWGAMFVPKRLLKTVPLIEVPVVKPLVLADTLTEPELINGMVLST